MAYRQLYKELKENPAELKLIEAAILNGITEEEIMKWYNISKKSWAWNKQMYKEFRMKIEQAKDKIVSEATRSLKVLSEGFKMKIKRLDRNGKEVIVEEYYPPDRIASLKILEAHRPEIWDTELKRKKIPKLSIEVKLEGKELEAFKKEGKRLKADFVVEDKE